MIPILLATSRASKSGDNRTYAFFCPSGLISVLTLHTLMSYNFLTADLIWCLLAFKQVIKTKVLLSSIFFIADSVVNGCLMMLCASIRFLAGVDFLGYLGCLAGLKVFGLLKWTEVRIFFTRVP